MPFMSEIVPKLVSELGYYQGQHEIPGIKFRYAGKDLGVTTWGMNVLELAPHCTTYPEHDHKADGEEEVYVVLSGSAVLQCGSRKWPLEVGTFVRVGPQHKRKIVTGSRGAVILALGGNPDKVEGTEAAKPPAKKATAPKRSKPTAKKG
jgi:mannose-6-phosphate isomerase-like protein (cupin superfamily)